MNVFARKVLREKIDSINRRLCSIKERNSLLKNEILDNERQISDHENETETLEEENRGLANALNPLDGGDK